MKRLHNFLYQYRYILIACAVFLIIRLPFLDQIFLLHDERDITFSGYAIAHTARDLNGVWMPLSFNNINPDNPLFAIYFSALWWIFVPVRSVLLARLPFVLLTTALPLLVYILIKQITGDRKVSLLTAILCCFSPWVFHVTRIAMDIPVAIMTLLIGIIAYFSKKRWITYIMFFITFYTYQGFRTLIPFLLIYMELFFFIKEKNIFTFIKRNAFNILFLIVTFLSILIIDKGVTAKRFDQVVFLNNEKFAPEVIFKRNTSIAPEIYRKIFHNKLTVTVNYIVSNFVKGQDISYLFKDGDYSPINGNGVGGQFLLPLIIFYYAGIAAFGKKFRVHDAYILGFMLLGYIPALASNVSATFSIRAMPTAIGFSYIMSHGIMLIWEYIKNVKPRYRYVVLSLFSGLLLISTSYFIYNYYFRRPVTISELFNEKERQLAQYLISSPKQYILYVNSPRDTYASYTFLNNDLALPEVQRSYNIGQPYMINTLLITKCPPKMNYIKAHSVIVSEGCMDKSIYDIMQNPRFPAYRIPYHDFSQKTAYFVIE
ncbi:MAG: hypothetical protein RI947_34 [Candidatus Parcubacteria bacterium]|jgi:hypothetical protein